MSEIRERAKIVAKEMKLTGWDRWADVITYLLAELERVEAEFKRAPLAYCGRHGYFVATNEDDECPRCELERLYGIPTDRIAELEAENEHIKLQGSQNEMRYLR